MTRQFKILYKTSIILIAVIATLLIGSVILVTIDADVFRTYLVILTEPLKNKIQLTEVIIRSIPLSVIALGITVAYRSGIINIGAEGQMAIGILTSTAAALAFYNVPRPLNIIIIVVCGAIGGGIWGFIPGILKAKLKVSELLSTVMLNYIAAQFYTFFLRGPMIDPAELTLGSGTPQSMRLEKTVWLDRLIRGTRLHTGIFLVFVLAIFIYILLWKTSFGYKLRAAGASEKAAKYGGIKVAFFVTVSMVISGAFAGIAGSVEILGVHHRAIEGITSGYGFSGLVVALFGGLHPAGIIPASFLFGLLLVGADMTQRIVGVPANMVQVLEGIIILVIVAAQQVLNDKYLMDKIWKKFHAEEAK
ncbi:MAG: ABC transporter permease [Sphaerochaetaceae bacterium]|nr:ABC transporter permease [Sphaerochaetaceae bacterium]MDC7236230.1 ABC transporter permease [Sphaerochaetaceae bacterium]MDC7248767.1 ABC transporter permease [Sphaerochaetaceae bacterium]